MGRTIWWKVSRKKVNCRCGRIIPASLKTCANCRCKGTKNLVTQALRKTVIDHYGGRCIACGEARLECLDLDHINRDGPSHRRELTFLGYPKPGQRPGYEIYYWLTDNNFPTTYGLQPLCKCCHLFKHGRLGKSSPVKHVYNKALMA